VSSILYPSGEANRVPRFRTHQIFNLVSPAPFPRISVDSKTTKPNSFGLQLSPQVTRYLGATAFPCRRGDGHFGSGHSLGCSGYDTKTHLINIL
jgi:hypothetical protein